MIILKPGYAQRVL